MKGYSNPIKIDVKGVNYWQVSFPNPNGGRRLRKSFKTQAEARNFSDKGNIQAANAGFEVASLSEERRREYLDAQKLLTPYNISVLEAVKVFVDAMAILEPYKANIQKAVNFFKKHNEFKKYSITLFDAYGKYLDSLEAQGLSERHRGSQEHRIGRFIKDMGESNLVATLNAAKIEDWLYTLKACRLREDKKASPRKNGTFPKVMQQTNKPASSITKNNYRTAIHAFLSYCQNKGYIMENPINKIKKVKETHKEPEIFTVDEMRYILNCTEPQSDIRAYMAIGAFAGLRRAEIERLTWDKINLKSGEIALSAGIAKTSQRRLVKMSDNLKEWLLPYSIRTRTSEKIVKDNFEDSLKTFRARNNIKWKQNALRHSAASYLIALTGNEYETAERLGNSVMVLRTHYKGLVSKEDAERYFDIRPIGADKGIISAKGITARAM